MSIPLDVRYGLRKLNHSLGFTVVAVSCLAIGICASVTVFSVVNALLLQPIPGAESPERLVSLAPKRVPLAGLPGELVAKPLSYPLFLRYQAVNHVFSDLVAYRSIPANLVMGGEPLRVKGMVVTENYFTTLGLRGALGHLFGGGEVRRATQPEAVISHRIWQRALGSRRRVLGSPVNLNGSVFEVTGVAPPGFLGTLHGEEVDVWVPIQAAPLVVANLRGGKLNDPGHGWLYWFFGRLAPEVNVERAQKDMDLLASQLEDTLVGEARPPELQIYRGMRIWPGSLGGLAKPLTLLSTVVGLLMLVVCANLGGLLLVKAAARQEEIGVRLALGVTRGRLARQLFTESVALAGFGGVTGLIMALWMVDALRGLSLGQYLPRINDLTVDARVVAFALGLSLATGILFGLIPALWSARQVAPLLRHSAVGGQSTGRSRLQEMFVVGQVMVSLLLLIVTGLFVRTLWNLQAIDPGFDSEGIVNLRLDLSLRDYDASSSSAFYEQLVPRVRSLPRVQDASLASWVHLSSVNALARLAELIPQSGSLVQKPVWSGYNVVSPGYFETLKIPILKGRDFSDADRLDSPPVLIVDETLARALWPGRNPIGERIRLKNERVREVVGVVRSVRFQDLQTDPRPYFYVPLGQRHEAAMALQVRTTGDPLQAVEPILSVIREREAHLGVQVSLYDDEMREAFAQPRLFSWVFGSFSLIAVTVTSIGLYGTLAYAVRRRMREMGIRMALGAQGSEVITMVLRRGFSLTGLGLLVGLTAAAWTTSMFSSLLYGVTPTDPGVFVGVAVLLTLVGLAASYLPASWATRIDPVAIIRHE